MHTLRSGWVQFEFFNVNLLTRGLAELTQPVTTSGLGGLRMKKKGNCKAHSKASKFMRMTRQVSISVNQFLTAYNGCLVCGRAYSS